MSKDNKDKEIQKILRNKFMKGPNYKLHQDDEENTIGINLFSGSKLTAFYEVWGKSQIFRVILMRPSTELFTIHYVGPNSLLFLLMEGEDQVKGGFVHEVEDLFDQLVNIFPSLLPNQIEELYFLWVNYIKDDYYTLGVVD